jgi:hypothetical protein
LKSVESVVLATIIYFLYAAVFLATLLG